MDFQHLPVSQSLLILGTVFSQFITKELSTSRNIKDRVNRQKVTSTLTKLGESLKTVKLSNKGNFFFFGYDEYDNFISVVLEPEREYKGFFYSCSCKFIVDPIFQFFERKYGSIIFISGEECLIYVLIDGQFHKKKTINGNLQKRQRKGGQSAVRIARLAEQSRDNYITRVVDHINDLRYCEDFDKYSIWITGSDEMKNMVLRDQKLLISINDAGFTTFNERTILEEKWFTLLDKKSDYNTTYEEVERFLNVNIDMLDFDVSKRNDPSIKYYLGLDGIPIPKVGSLSEFTYIGVKYYCSDSNDNFEE